MKMLIAYSLLVAGLASASQATEVIPGDEMANYEQVKTITAFRGPHSWTALDDDTLIVWANAFDPYLVKLKQPTQELRFAQAIGITQFGSQIHAATDAVQIRGFRYPIGALYKLTREEAKRLTQDARG